MTLPLSALFLALFGLSLILVILSLVFLRGTPQAYQPMSAPARFFLVALRLAIGWHCFFEGVEKFSAANWSGEAYLRESMGPFAEHYRAVAGDRLVEKLTVAENGTLSPQLDREWRTYVNAFTSFYALTPEQVDGANKLLEKRETDTLTALTKAEEEVTTIAPYPPPLKVPMTMKRRLQEHQRLLDKVREIEDEFPSSVRDEHTQKLEVQEKWKGAKADLNKWRADLKKSLDAETDKLKKGLDDLLTSEQKQKGPMPRTIVPPMGSWQLLEWSDQMVKWSLVILGGCLMLGLFSRLSSFGAALLILSFYLAMPPLPGWPESPRLEGHYVLINKTLIEVIALLALAFIPTGRWAGLDGVLHFVFGRRPEVQPRSPQA